MITGGAGFIGSHLVDNLMKKGERVICLDNFISGAEKNISKWLRNPNFELINHDIVNPIDIEVDRIWHLACPASPIQYQIDPIKTTRTNFLGTYNMLELARLNKGKILLASTSEVYGDPQEHPQKETYKGSVNSIGPRSCYVEGKRIAESLCLDYFRIHSTQVRIARIFNAYGPRMNSNDGRVISNFICQALNNKPLTIYGSGSQTRSFCFVSEIVDGLVLLMNSEYNKPVNLGNDSEEVSILELAKLITKKVNPYLQLHKCSLPNEDPMKRRPVIDLAKQILNWQPSINIDDGLNKTINYFKQLI